MSEEERLALANLDLELHDIEVKIQSQGKLLTDKARSIVDLASYLTGRKQRGVKEQTDFNPTRLAELVNDLGLEDYEDSKDCSDLKSLSARYLELEDDRKSKKYEYGELKEKLSNQSS